jgi:hypothetical protein
MMETELMFQSVQFNGRELIILCLFYQPIAVTIVKSSKSLVSDSERKHLRKMEKIHWRLRNGYFVIVDTLEMLCFSTGLVYCYRYWRNGYFVIVDTLEIQSLTRLLLDLTMSIMAGVLWVPCWSSFYWTWLWVSWRVSWVPCWSSFYWT